MNVMEAICSLKPNRISRKALYDVEENGWKFPTPEDQLLILDLVIVAYLPNEQDIIMDRIHYALDHIVYPHDRIRINVLYNTPKAIEPVESEMNELAAKIDRLRIIKVPDSTSKAHNLNYFFTLYTGAQIIALYDCDHYSHPYGPRWAVERFLADEEVDCVQGRCVIQNSKATFLTGTIAVEFDKIYGTSHPGRAALFGYGLFTGSNGYWRANLPRDLKMDATMLTEDIDSALRALEQGSICIHEPNVISYELAPTTFHSFLKQRLRWVQGWTQASYRHCMLAYKKSPHNKKRNLLTRFGLLSLLLIRELSYYLVSQYTCLMLSFLITGFLKTGTQLKNLIFFEFPASEWLFIIGTLCLIGSLAITYFVLSELITKRMMVKFTLLYPFYLILGSCIGLYGHFRQIVRYSAWNATVRS
ncbi:hypothetical protein SS1G_12321 [Sclerotinia sclerotiorum 1980 UF-70]|uniref:Glycosyltransferase 2-like domain-containing protein n=2 Tax=Sclerotinia sclerotiorum (strain ATCC 18683 / 1980 / Ss-1) TaxID=665079 RepID=A7F323_SCLS1|nr:hypothetical protein SS1G_12321 [Sclerotinia sclerotiorum 1980 UF-70]APA09510.1 hypothetical protein sscle_05g042800 [Sclerotinia sclerotiorum 1980 UF-70]EDN96115.1 hypothetical protein SS1G_12321 [Sclerotinia sclerotiorum 1980 UF-70]